MILTTLTIHDFGVFRGEHTVDLSPKDRRPIVMFGGKNGAGKSTILEAIRLCLYGVGSLGGAVSRDEYLRFLGTKIHNNPNALIQPTFASIKVQFRYTHTEGIATYTVARSWERRGAGRVSESLSIERDGKVLKEVEAESWQEFIRELIPPGVSQLFFFDGEKIQQLAEDTIDHQALADAIKSLLGVDIVERLQSDLRLHFSRLAKPGKGITYMPEIRKLERTIQSLRRKISKLRQHRAEHETKIQEFRANVLRVETTFSSQGGVFARNRDHLIQQEGTLKERITQIEETIRTHCAGLLPFAIIPNLCADVKDQLTLEEDVARAKAGQALLLSGKKELYERLSPTTLLDGIAELGHKSQNEISHRISSALTRPLRAENVQIVDLIHQLSETHSRALVSWIDQATSELPKSIDLISTDLERANRELHSVSETLRKIPNDDVLKPILDELHLLNEKLIKASTDAILKDQQIKDLELELFQAERLHSQLAQRLASEAKHSGKLHVLPRVQTALEEYRLKLIENKVAHLQESVTDCFNLLCRKKDSLRRIRIDPKNFSIILCDRNNSPLPQTQLSAGEKQIYAISMLWALGKTSGRPLPIVIDTPLARLDSDHRKLLVQHYFPFASHQVIMLSTDTEVDQVYFDALVPAIARAYHLDYDQHESNTVISQGYFWSDHDEAYKVAAN